MNKTLVVDIGGTHVKLMLEGAEQRIFDSGPQVQPADLIGPSTTSQLVSRRPFAAAKSSVPRNISAKAGLGLILASR